MSGDCKKSNNFMSKLAEENGKWNEQRFQAILEKDYFAARNDCKDQQTAMNQHEFDERCRDFVLNWFLRNANVGENPPDLEQAMAISSMNKNIEVVARAGSGKTTTIIGRANFLINHCHVDPGSILMLAFNRKAAEEMRERMKILVGEGPGRMPHIKTFHSLAYAVANRRKELQKPIIFDNDDAAEFDPKDSNKALSQVVQQIVHEMIRENYDYAKRFRNLMTGYFRGVWQTIEKGGYNLPAEDQMTLRRSLETKTLNGEEVESIKEKIVADILFEHNVPYKPWIKNGTIIIQINPKRSIRFMCTKEQKKDEYYTWMLHKRNTIVLGPKEFNKGETSIVHIIGDALSRENKPFIRLQEQEIWEKIQVRAIDEFTKAMTAFVGRCRKKDFSVKELTQMVRKHEAIVPVEKQFLDLALELYSFYINYLEEKGWEDFDGLVKRAAQCIKHGQTTFDKTGDFRKITHIMIDEYQDFSLLFDMFITEIQKVCPNASLFCVGDDWQAINAFAGSDTSFFNKFEKRFNDARRYYLTTNYRSVPEIVKTGNAHMDTWGKGVNIHAFREEAGIVRIGDLDGFTVSLDESEIKADKETIAVVRLIRWLLKRDKRVVLLFRVRAKLDAGYLRYIRSFFSYEDAQKITAFTTHKYKGKQEDAVIIMDAVERRYPLIHPTWFFMRIFDDDLRRRVLSENSIDIVGDVTLRKLVGDEKRLFYVALTRAKDCMFILTKAGNESRFLTTSVKEEAPELIWNEYASETGNQNIITIIVKNNGNTPTTIFIKKELHEAGYKFESAKKYWYKSLQVRDFKTNPILQEKWLKKARNVFIDICDKNGKPIEQYVVNSSGKLRNLKDVVPFDLA